MLSVVVFVVGLVLVGGLLFLGAALLFGRGETQPPADVGRASVELPAGRAVLGDDVRAVQLSVAVRGYRMTEVDWLLDQLAGTLDERDHVIAQLRATHEQPDAGAPAARTAGTIDAVPSGPAPDPARQPTNEELPGA